MSSAGEALPRGAGAGLQLRLGPIAHPGWCSVAPRRRCWPRRAGRGARTEMVLRRLGGGAVPPAVDAQYLDPAPAGAPPCSLGGIGVQHRWLGHWIAGLLRDMGVAAHALSPDDVRRNPAIRRSAGLFLAGSRPGRWWRTGERSSVLPSCVVATGVLLTSGHPLARPD